jgi:hypothetical protein
MDHYRFDSLTRSIALATSRRGALRVLAATIAGGGLGAVTRLASARACRLVGETCGDRDRCCSGSSCSPQSQRCVCRPGLTNCGGTCVDLRTDDRNCGECSAACDDGVSCCEGQCSVSPDDGTACCNGEFANTTESDDHCGGCGQACPAGTHCCNSRCRDLQSDRRYCATCYTSCAAGGGQCEAGVCHCHAKYDCGSANRCGRPPGFACRVDADCCSGFCEGGDRCSPCEGQFCDADSDCCGDFPCQRVEGDQQTDGGRCGGCIATFDICDPAKNRCCFSDCIPDKRHPGGSYCRSERGGPCRRDIDCTACERGTETSECIGACQDGRCIR